MIAAMRAVVEDREVAVGQGARVVLLGERRPAELPRDGAGGVPRAVRAALNPAGRRGGDAVRRAELWVGERAARSAA